MCLGGVQNYFSVCACLCVCRWKWNIVPPTNTDASRFCVVYTDVRKLHCTEECPELILYFDHGQYNGGFKWDWRECLPPKDDTLYLSTEAFGWGYASGGSSCCEDEAVSLNIVCLYTHGYCSISILWKRNTGLSKPRSWWWFIHWYWYWFKIYG